MSEIDEDFYLDLSGLKHFVFCRRRWALIHIEQQWQENALTLEGQYLHERVHDESLTEKRGSVVLSRGMRVSSRELGISGICDLVELYQEEQGIPIQGRAGKWRVYPVEYKHGRPDPTHADEWQLCAQAMCLEEMLLASIPEGALYYAELRHRMMVPLDSKLRADVRGAVQEMHRLMDRRHVPGASEKKACQSCSLQEICQPAWQNRPSAAQYVKHRLAEEEL